MSDFFDTVIVGAGISGITAACVLAREKNETVLIVEKRGHIGGNCYDRPNEDGILYQVYGPHIFHTNHQHVWDFLSRFTKWNQYVHYVKAFIDGKYLTFPININTFEELFDKPFSKKDVEAYLERETKAIKTVSNAEDMVISRMGKKIYDTFFKNYTKKQWGVDAVKLPPEITARIPIRLNRDNRFFTDSFQGVPEKGFTHLMQKMIDHENIRVMTSTNFTSMKDYIQYNKLIYTGPMDEFFDFKYGPLPYRGIRFKFKSYAQKWVLPVGVVNYPNDHEYTRATEFKYLTKQEHEKTCLCYEYPSKSFAGQENPVPSYPILNKASLKSVRLYEDESKKYPKVIFMGRLGTFRYLNMDICVKEVIDRFLK